MHSRTKVPVDEPALLRAVGAVTGRPTDAQVRPLTDGMFNAAYALRYADGSRVVVKVAPPPGTPVLSYERDLMRTELDFYRRASGHVPVPTVLGADLSRDHLDRDLLVMAHLDGRPLTKVRRALGRDDRTRVRQELGAAVARLRAVRGTRFGYDRPDGALSGPSWGTAFAAMVTAILTDADRYGVRLPAAAARLPERLTAAAPELDRVSEPVLVHFDLWDGNLFVAGAGTGAHLEAVTDGERAFWGDPLAELASTALFGDPGEDAGFNAGWEATTGGPLDLGPDARLRLALYRAYLYLVMTVERAPRGYRGVEARLVDAVVRTRLRAELRAIRRRLG